MAVADGHGSARYFRSDRGSRLAVKAAAFAISCVLQRFQDRESDSSDLHSIKTWFEQHLPRLIVRKWVEYARRDLDARPYGPEEIELLARESSGPARKGPLAGSGRFFDPEIEPYGSTLGLGMVTGTFIAYASIGDVDVVKVSKEGLSVRALAASNEVGEVTDSLCSPDAVSRFQAELHALDEAGYPALIFVGTDGFSKSYRTEKAFLDTCRAYAIAVREANAYVLEDLLHGWLTETTNEGSGDDITIGLLFDVSKPLLAEGTNANANGALVGTTERVDDSSSVPVSAQTQALRVVGGTGTDETNCRVESAAHGEAWESPSIISRLNDIVLVPAPDSDPAEETGE